MATTLVTGASLAGSFSLRTGLLLIVSGVLMGSALVAALAPLGPRLGVPSIIAARAALGVHGGALLALFLYVSNFAWIALNNVIAASACARIAGGARSERGWAVALGVVATAVVALGPRAVALANRVAVPLMVAVGVLMVVRVFQLPPGGAPPTGALGVPVGLDVVVGYQVSWILMFADYSRYTASARAGAWAVFLALVLSGLWLMPVGLAAARATGSTDPGAMALGLGLSAFGAVLITLATVTTNFVNIYLSALAWKSLFPRAPESFSVWSIGLIGAGLSLFSRSWIDRYADFMLLIGGALVPVGGILLARFFASRRPVHVDALYAADGEYASLRAALPGLTAWAAGAFVYFAASRWGGTLPALATAAATYLMGGSVLRRFTVTLDYARGRLLLKPNRHFGLPFLSGASGIDFRLDEKGGGYRVERVLPGSAAEKVGLAPGDVITAIDGTPSRRLNMDDVERLLQAESGRRRLDVARGGRSRRVVLKLKPVV